MLPADRCGPSFLSFLQLILYRVDRWIRQEIVDDDPWDTESLFTDSQAPSSEPTERSESAK